MAEEGVKCQFCTLVFEDEHQRADHYTDEHQAALTGGEPA